jgi:hypothetical protein
MMVNDTMETLNIQLKILSRRRVWIIVTIMLFLIYETAASDRYDNDGDDFEDNDDVFIGVEQLLPIPLQQ